MVEEEEKVYEDDVVEESEQSRGGRGRRGGRGGYQGGRGGGNRRGRGGLSGYAARNEFEGDEDEDDQVYSAPPTKAKRNKQKVEDLKMDEDNYPAL